MSRPYEDQAERVKLYKGSLRQWAVTNWGVVRSVHHTRKEAIAWAVENDNANYSWRMLYEIRRVTITEGWTR